MAVTTFRSDLVAAHLAILAEQVTASPTLLKKVYSARPGAYNELPLAFIGPRPETIEHDSGNRMRTIPLEVWVVDSYAGDNSQTGDRLDQLVDLLMDRYDLPANVQRVPSAIIELTSIDETDIEVSNAVSGQITHYRALVFTFAKCAKREGRQ